MPSYLEHFRSFINARLPTYRDFFTKEDMVAWIKARDNRTPRNVVEHLLKRTTNYASRDENNPPSRPHDDLFFRVEPNLFRRYQPSIDPEPLHLSSSGRVDHKKAALSNPRPTATSNVGPQLLPRFQGAVTELDTLLAGRILEDENVQISVRQWLDGTAEPLPWKQSEGITPDEWFFITTLYGTMTAEGQRTHIRRFFPTLFVIAAKRDIRNFIAGMEAFAGLRFPWMSKRLCRMGQVLREKRLTMAEYVDQLREIERRTTPENPMPACDALVWDHRAGGSKTLSVFVRDCVGGNCFPIDSRVEEELARYQLPADERMLVRLSLLIGRNPRQVARMFYEVGPVRS